MLGAEKIPDAADDEALVKGVCSEFNFKKREEWPRSTGRRPGHALQRAVDRVGASVALAALSPALLTIAALVKIDSAGPVLVWQWRRGMDGRRFQAYSFRSVRAGLGDEAGLDQAEKLTGMGAVLRRTHLDELPQLINVLKGDMPLFAPHCHAAVTAGK